jgi:hypothetical protein
MSKIKNFFRVLWSRVAIPLIIIVVGVIVGLIFGGKVGFFTVFGLIGGLVIFVFGRQLYWWITKTGDYKVYDDVDD